MDEIVGNSFEEKYESIRRVAEHENELINHRVSWLLIAQSFLLAACVTNSCFPMYVVVLGALSTLITYVSIVSALIATIILRNKISGISEFENRVPSAITNGAIFHLGNLGAWAVPPIFFLAWLYGGFYV